MSDLVDQFGQPEQIGREFMTFSFQLRPVDHDLRLVLAGGQAL